MSVSGGIYIYTGAFFILFCFQEIIAPEAGACSPYLLDSEYSAWSIFYMTGLYFRTDDSYIILIDFFLFSFFSPLKQRGRGGIEIVMKEYQGNSTQICNYQEPPESTSIVLLFCYSELKIDKQEVRSGSVGKGKQISSPGLECPGVCQRGMVRRGHSRDMK